MNQMQDIKPRIEDALNCAGYEHRISGNRDKWHRARADNVWFDQQVVRADKGTQGAAIVRAIAGKPNGSATEEQQDRFDSWYTDGYRSYGTAAI